MKAIRIRTALLGATFALACAPLLAQAAGTSNNTGSGARDTTTGSPGSTTQPRVNSRTNIDDSTLTQRIRDELNNDPETRAQLSNVQIEARNGEVTLRGQVGSDEIRQQIEQRVASIDGVRNVRNQIRTY